MSGYTPGPWRYDGPRNNKIVWGGGPDNRICFLTSDGPTEANARLIAASPELLEALDKCIEWIESEGAYAPKEAYAARDKARGEPK